MPFETTVAQESGYPVITLTDTETGCQAEIYGFGALLNAFSIRSIDKRVNVVDGFVSVKDAVENITNGFKSTKLSPFVCRMDRGHYSFGDKDYIIQKYFLSGHAIHGLLYDGSFEVTGTVSGVDHAAVTLHCEYKATDPGYPFPYGITVEWKLETGNQLTVTTKISHQNATAIPIADGWHPYFTLGASVDDCTLQFDSDRQLEYNADLLPTGRKFTDTRFTKGILLKGIELDNSFELEGSATNAGCILENDVLRLTISPDKNYPILQIYIPPHRKSIAIENLSGAPDNFNNGMGLIHLVPGEIKKFRTTYRVGLKK